MATNEYGLDVKYFQRLISRELNDISRQTPSDLARVFARMSKAADPKVMMEPEFTSPTEDKLIDALENIKKHIELSIKNGYELSTVWNIASKALKKVKG